MATRISPNLVEKAVMHCFFLASKVPCMWYHNVVHIIINNNLTVQLLKNCCFIFLWAHFSVMSLFLMVKDNKFIRYVSCSISHHVWWLHTPITWASKLVPPTADLCACDIKKENSTNIGGIRWHCKWQQNRHLNSSRRGLGSSSSCPVIFRMYMVLSKSLI